jgi:4-hydroxybenzoyl-CoA reductase subunit alpha
MANEVAVPRVDPPRVDIRDKVSGGAQYLDDLPDLPGTVYAAALRSPYSHAKIVSIDSSRAERLEGVLAVLDREHLDEYDVHFEQGGVNNYFITTDRARFDGDMLAMVVATDLRTARCAVELIDVDYDLRPTLFTVNEALAPGAPRIHEQLADNQALADTLEWATW